MEKVNIVVEQELPDGRTYPVVAMTLGKYKREAVEINAQNWSSDVSLDSNTIYSIPGKCAWGWVLSIVFMLPNQAPKRLPGSGHLLQ